MNRFRLSNQWSRLKWRLFIVCLIVWSPLGVESAMADAAISRADGSGDGSDRILVPGGWSYRGDVAYEIVPAEDPAPWKTIPGLFSDQLGWADAWFAGSLGLRRYSPGLLFQGTLCPIPGLWTVLPSGGVGRVDLLNFPAGGWWGPACGVGAIQLRAPALNSRSRRAGKTWFSESDFGLSGSVSYPWGSLEGAWNRTKNPDENWGDHPSLSSSAFVSLGMSWEVGGEALFLRRPGAYWEVLEGSVLWKSGNFQEIRISPFVQRACLGTLEASEAGVRLDHRFSLAGILVTHLGAGLSDKNTEPMTDEGRAGYIRFGFFVDALGLANLDAMFRVDGRDGAHGVPSSQAGVKVPLGSFALVASISDNAWREGSGPAGPGVETRTASQSLGVGYRISRSTTVRIRGLHEKIGPDRCYAFVPEWSSSFKTRGLRPLRSLRLDVSADWRKATGPVDDESRGAVLRFDALFSGGWNFWALERVQQGVAAALQCGVAWRHHGLDLDLRVDNATGTEVAWPEPSAPTGRIVRGSAGFSW